MEQTLQKSKRFALNLALKKKIIKFNLLADILKNNSNIAVILLQPIDLSLILLFWTPTKDYMGFYLLLSCKWLLNVIKLNVLAVSPVSVGRLEIHWQCMNKGFTLYFTYTATYRNCKWLQTYCSRTEMFVQFYFNTIVAIIKYWNKMKSL